MKPPPLFTLGLKHADGVILAVAIYLSAIAMGIQWGGWSPWLAVVSLTVAAFVVWGPLVRYRAPRRGRGL